jgi:hypothetical protein
LVNHYGIDIQHLDTALAGEQIQETEADRIRAAVDREMAPYRSQMVAAPKAQAEAIQTELQEFSKTHEFLLDVRGDMADLFDIASKRGQKVTLEEIYKKACAMNPEVTKVMAERAMRLNKGKPSKKDAASSIHGKGQKSAPPKGAMSIGDTIRDVWGDQ